MRLNAHVWGEGPPVVCVHGVTGHGERFRRLAEDRLPGRRVIAVDLRGHGRSGWEPPWTLETHVSDLAETADALGVEGATWIGFSFGGRLVAELALRDPWRVQRLVLLDPALHLPPAFALSAAEDELSPQRFRTRAEAVDARLADGSLISTPREFLEEEMRQHLAQTIDGRFVKRYSVAAAVAAWGEMSRPPVPPAAIPTLFVAGSESDVPTAEHIARYRAALGSTVRTVEMLSGHSLLWDAFEETAAEIAGFA